MMREGDVWHNHAIPTLAPASLATLLAGKANIMVQKCSVT